MKSPTPMPRLLARGLRALLAASCVVFAPCVAPPAGAGTPAAAEEFKVTIVFLVRHAEKADAPREDPPLDENGRSRSRELARVLGQSGIRAIYTSQFLRARQTAEPLSGQLGLTPHAVPVRMSPTNPAEVSAQSVAELTGKIYERAGDSVLVIGHSNTIPEVIKMLGGDVVPKIDEKKFDDLFVVTVYGRGKAKVAHVKYGSSN